MAGIERAISWSQVRLRDEQYTDKAALDHGMERAAEWIEMLRMYTGVAVATARRWRWWNTPSDLSLTRLVKTTSSTSQTYASLSDRRNYRGLRRGVRKMHLKPFGSRVLSKPAAGTYSAPTDPLVRLRVWGRWNEEWENETRREGEKGNGGEGKDNEEKEG